MNEIRYVDGVNKEKTRQAKLLTLYFFNDRAKKSKVLFIREK